MQVYVGYERKVCDKDCVCSDLYLQDYTVHWTLWLSKDGSCGFIRVFDLDAEELVGITKFKDQSKAMESWKYQMEQINRSGFFSENEK